MDLTESSGTVDGGGSKMHLSSTYIFGNNNQPQLQQKGDHEVRIDVEREPGYAWNNKKARDEYQRAMELVVDKNFNLRIRCIFLDACDNADNKIQANLETFSTTKPQLPMELKTH